jgi:hypothetical protein
VLALLFSSAWLANSLFFLGYIRVQYDFPFYWLDHQVCYQIYRLFCRGHPEISARYDRCQIWRVLAVFCMTAISCSFRSLRTGLSSLRADRETRVKKLNSACDFKDNWVSKTSPGDQMSSVCIDGTKIIFGPIVSTFARPAKRGHNMVQREG